MNNRAMKEQEASPSNYPFENLYQALFEQAADGIFIANAQGRYIEVNSSGCRMLGYTREERNVVYIAKTAVFSRQKSTHKCWQTAKF